MIKFYHRWSSMEAQQVRLALSYKAVTFISKNLPQRDDAIWFKLGMARSDLLLRIPGHRYHTNAAYILRNMDLWFGSTPIFNGLVSEAAWQALLKWRDEIRPLRERLYAPILPAFIDIGIKNRDLTAYKNRTSQRYNMSVEALSSDRYDGFNQLVTLSHLDQLSRHLAQNRFYLNNTLSACDIVIACDLFPLQLLDGVTMPLDLMYYIQRVENTCNASLRDGLISQH